MRIVGYEGPGSVRSWGLVEAGGILDVGRRPEVEAPTFTVALRTTSLMDVALSVVGLPADVDPDTAHIVTPVDPLGREPTGLALVIGTSTATLADQDPLEFVAGATHGARDGWDSMVVTRDEWRRPDPTVPDHDAVVAALVARLGAIGTDRIAATVRAAARARLLLPGTLVPLRR